MSITRLTPAWATGRASASGGRVRRRRRRAGSTRRAGMAKDAPPEAFHRFRPRSSKAPGKRISSLPSSPGFPERVPGRRRHGRRAALRISSNEFSRRDGGRAAGGGGLCACRLTGRLGKRPCCRRKSSVGVRRGAGTGLRGCRRVPCRPHRAGAGQRSLRGRGQDTA